MPDNGDNPLFEKMQRTMDFILEQQANMVVQQATADERAREASVRHDRQMAQIEKTLDRAVRLTIRESLNQRKRRHALEARTKELEARADRTETRSQELEVQTDKTDARSREAEARSKEAEARSKEAEARSKELEVQTDMTEVRSREAEARSKEMEAQSNERFQRIEILQAETTEKLNALVHIVDGWIRRSPGV